MSKLLWLALNDDPAERIKMNLQGFWLALAAYGLWGFLPIYWKLIQHVPSLQILMHRMVWSLGFLALLLLLQKDWSWLKDVVRDKKLLAIYFFAAFLLSINWGIYIWAVNANFIIETSLGYFISPLVSVFVGVLVFKEKLRSGQWFAIGIATLGVLVLTLIYGRLPWIALSLAFSWNIYAALKKFAPLSALRGLALETAILFPAALGALIYLDAASSSSFATLGVSTVMLLLMSGVATATPLLFFTAAAKRLPLNTLGMMQYFAPTIQLFIGIFIYHEFFDLSRLVGFAIIWSSLIIFTFEGLRHRRKLKLAAA